MAKLEHDSKLIERLAQMHEGNAVAHMKRAEGRQNEPTDAPRPKWTQHQMLAASGFVIAASYWSLIDAHKALTLYRDAARVYRALGHDYWMVLALFTGDSNWTASVLSTADEISAPNPQTVAFAMICNEMYDAAHRSHRTERLLMHWRQVGNYPVGRLGVPLDYYARFAKAMHYAREKKDPGIFLAEAGNYVNRAAEVLSSASHDRFHWLKLESTIRPAEPEAVAMTTAMAIISHSMFNTSIREMPHLDEHGRLLVEVGDDMWRAAQRPDEGQR